MFFMSSDIPNMQTTQIRIKFSITVRHILTKACDAQLCLKKLFIFKLEQRRNQYVISWCIADIAKVQNCVLFVILYVLSITKAVKIATSVVHIFDVQD